MLKKKFSLAIFYGTRPEFLKVIPLIKLIRKKYKTNIELRVVSVGQHRELLNSIEEEFDFEPDHRFKLIDETNVLSGVYGRTIERVHEYISIGKFDAVLAQGDTATVFAVSLASYLNMVPFIHLEAGMRTNNKYSPFPEEINRRLSSCVADLHLCWTDTEKENLIRENYRGRDIYVTGNTVIDTLLETASKTFNLNTYFGKSDLAARINNGSKVILMTEHRRENQGKGHTEIFSAVKEILKKNKNYVLVYPVHFNPNVKKLAAKTFSGVKNVFLIEPLPYTPFVKLMARSSIIITDSGGIQEEAPSLGIPLLVTREFTERPLVISEGKAFLVGSKRSKIISAFNQVEKEWDYKSRKNPYGDGKSAERIVNILIDRYGK